MPQTEVSRRITPVWRAWLSPALLALLLAGCATRPPEQRADAPAIPAKAEAGVQLTLKADRAVVSVAGRLFTEYRFASVPKPILYPVIGPTGDAMTRHFPMANPPGEEHDHPHHRSVWFGHGLVNGVDFWTERAGSGRIVHRGFSEWRSGPLQATLRSQNDWLDAQGRAICADERTLTFHRGNGDARWIDFEITLRATNGELVFGDTREGTLGVRVAESMRVTHGTGGHIENSEGQTDLGAWGRRARWCDYSGPVEGGIAGVAILDHPANPRHPTWWMVRDYGLLAANPFGQHEFEKLDDAHVGDLKIPAGESVTFRYRIVFHRGELNRPLLDELGAEFSAR